MGTIKLSKYTEVLIKDICSQFQNEEGELINILHAIQEKIGYLPREIQELVAKEVNLPVAKVYGVVSFYSYFTMKPQGDNPISVCMGTACYVRGSEKVLDEFKRQLGISVGETTVDGRFSLCSLRCVGACGLAPVVMVGKKVYGRVSTQDVGAILDEYRSKAIKGIFSI